MQILVTDKTGTLTTGKFRLASSLTADGVDSDVVARLALLAAPTERGAGGARTGDPLDVALWSGVHDAAAVVAASNELAMLPFDHERRMTSALVGNADGSKTLVAKGAPEAVLSACGSVSAAERATVDQQLAAGGRVIAVASRNADALNRLTTDDEKDLALAGLLVFDDPPKLGARDALERLASLDVRVIIATGDSAGAAARLAAAVGLTTGVSSSLDPLSGTEIDQLDDDQLSQRLAGVAVLARVSPEQKARAVRVLSAKGTSVGFLGDGVNDALALHQADVGLSVNTAADVARAAADVVLLEKSLDVMADGIAQGRRIFANTIKYVLMGTSSKQYERASKVQSQLLARRPHEHVLDGVGEDPAALGDAVGDDVEALLQQHNVGRGTRDIGGGIDRDPDIGLMQGQRVVDPIAQKADRLTARGQDADDAGLLFGRDASKDGRGLRAGGQAVVVELLDLGPGERLPTPTRCQSGHSRGQPSGRTGAVAGRHNDPDVEGGQPVERVAHARLRRVVENQQSGQAKPCSSAGVS